MLSSNYDNIMISDDEDQSLLDNADSFLDQQNVCTFSYQFFFTPKLCSTVDNDNNKAKKQLICASVLCVIFMIVEMIGGYYAGSLAIMTDAAHLVTDSLTFFIGAFAISWSNKKADEKMSFGYKRIEVFGAVISIIGIWILTLFILYFAVQRLLHIDDFEIDTNTMLAVSMLGIMVNIVMAIVLHGGSCSGFNHNHSHGNVKCNHTKDVELPGLLEVNSTSQRESFDFNNNNEDDHEVIFQQNKHQGSKEKNLNVEAALLHVLGDFLQSIGVVVAAIIIKINPNAKIIDPLCTFLFSIIVIFTTIKIFRKSVAILLEAVPSDVSYSKLMSDLQSIEGVSSVHNLKIWSMSIDIHVMSAHIIINDIMMYEKVLTIASKLAEKSGINHTTIQIEIK
ncbi:unnamed protein product [Diamesa tonsa]